jgi:hypothetical protein
LIDGESIVDLMIEKEFGVQIETLSIPSYAIDLALGNDETTVHPKPALTTPSTRTRRNRRDG